MRPDVAAFRELDTLVRNLSEQLAGYRRRALAAESRSRDLEQDLSALEAKLQSALEASREAARESARQSAAGSGTEPASLPVGSSALDSMRDSSAALSLENERLRARLADARERTSLVADRVRFLRQQLTSGVER